MEPCRTQQCVLGTEMTSTRRETDLVAHLKKATNETLPYLLQHDVSLLLVNHDLSRGPEFRSDHGWQTRFFLLILV